MEDEDYGEEIPNAETRAAIERARQREQRIRAEIAAGKAPRFKTLAEFFSALEAGAATDEEYRPAGR